ncbi:MAG: hypothetical protein WA446_07550 [Steroidobacteraceae bacterium]
MQKKALVEGLSRAGDARLAEVLSAIVNYQAMPEQAAREANEAGVRMLVFNHMSPVAPDNILSRRIFARAVSSIQSKAQ